MGYSIKTRAVNQLLKSPKMGRIAWLAVLNSMILWIHSLNPGSIILSVDAEDPRTNRSVAGNIGILDLRMTRIKYGTYTP
jgi:hypothetical protein